MHKTKLAVITTKETNLELDAFHIPDIFWSIYKHMYSFTIKTTNKKKSFPKILGVVLTALLILTELNCLRYL